MGEWENKGRSGRVSKVGRCGGVRSEKVSKMGGGVGV